MAETLDNNEIGVSQQLVNIDSTTIQHLDPVENSKKGHKPDQISNSVPQKISQQSSTIGGEREGV